MKFYLDTNIWLDYFQNRSSGLLPIGEFAFIFLKKAIELDIPIYYSDLILDELSRVSKNHSKNEIIQATNKKAIFIKTTNQDLIVAKQINKLKKIHFADALHIAIAKRLDATIISRDKHFYSIDLTDVYLPEEVIFD
jgi:predicted nucleic acid-binding protein